VTGGGGAPDHLTWGTQPTDTETNSAITPAVTVNVVDSCGNPATGAGNVTVAIGDDPSAGTAILSGTKTQSAATGTATFSNLSIDVSGADYSLLASYTGLTSVESSSFDVVDQLCTSSDLFCEVSNDTTKVQTAAPTGDATMALSLSVGSKSFTCDGVALTSDGSLALIDPTGYTAPYTVTLTYDKAVASGTGVANFVVCLSKDGVSYTQLSDCKNKHPNPPCILSRNRTGVGDLEIVLLLDPSDPYAGTAG